MSQPARKCMESGTRGGGRASPRGLGFPFPPRDEGRLHLPLGRWKQTSKGRMKHKHDAPLQLRENFTFTRAEL